LLKTAAGMTRAWGLPLSGRRKRP